MSPIAATRTSTLAPQVEPPFPDERYRVLFDAMEEGVVFHDADGVIRAFNISAERILRAPAGSLLGKTSALQACKAVSDDGTPYPLDSCPALVSLKTSRSYTNVVIGIESDGAAVKWLSFNSHPLRRPDDPGIHGVVTTFTDITDRRHADARRVRLYEEAQDALRSREEFLAIAAHELRTPLTALQLHLQGLLRSAAAEGALKLEHLRTKLKLASRQTDRLNTLVGVLLDVSRITAGRLELSVERMNLGQLVHEVVTRNADELARSGCDVTCAVLPDVVGDWDPMRIEQVITNLLSNAAKYGRGHPVSFEVTASGDEATLRVSDNGIGIATPDHARIFQRFERAVPETNYGGMGLGLWIVHRIVEAHQGTISVESAPGVGSSFLVSLPLATAD